MCGPSSRHSSSRSPTNSGTYWGSIGDTLQSTVAQIEVDVAIEVGSSEIALQEVTELDVGDVVLLDRRVDESLPLLMGGVEKYRGKLGRIGGSLGFRVSEVAGKGPASSKEEVA